MTNDIEKLTDWQHARICTEMFLSSRERHSQCVLEYGPDGPVAVQTCWVPALFTAFREILDNALDEVVAHGEGGRIDVSYDPQTMIFSVSDDGRGIPIDFDPVHNLHKATLALSHTKAGRNFGVRGQTRGVNGVGASIVNYCSEYFDLTVWRNGQEFSQHFNEGDGSNTDLVVQDPVIRPGHPDRHGTTVTFKPSRTVFADMTLPERFIAARMTEVGLCYGSADCQISYNGEPVVALADKVEETLFARHQPVFISISEMDQNFKSKFWLVPDFMADGSEYTHSLVNGIALFNGGSHIDQFRRSFFTGLLQALKRESARRRLEPNRSDISEGLLIFNITQMQAPVFDSQSKSRLINENVAGIIRRKMDEGTNFFTRIIKDYPAWIETIYQRCEARTHKKTADDVGKVAKKARREKIEDLQDACGPKRSECILFLTEGKSAVAGMTDARNPEIHAGLALRGKPMNVREKPLAEVMANVPLTNVMKAIGIFPNQRVNRHLLRYGRVYLTTDADQDGSNIAALLVNFFHFFWPDLFDPEKPPFIHVFDTPLIIAMKGKQRKFWYKQDYDSFDAEKYKGWEITRAKGLAAMKKPDWQLVLASPKLIPIIDDGQLAHSLKLLFDKGPRAADARKNWIGR